MPRADDPPTRRHVASVPGGEFQHTPQIQFCEAPVFHALQEMWAQFEFPLPPGRPAALSQILLPLSRVLIRFWLDMMAVGWSAAAPLMRQPPARAPQLVGGLLGGV